MKAGRHLDILVGRVVFGWTVEAENVYSADEPDRVWFTTRESPGLATELPFFSTDRAAAWEVVRRMNERQYVLEMTVYTGGDADISFVWEENDYGHAYAPDRKDLPWAICVAALRALGEEVDGP